MEIPGNSVADGLIRDQRNSWPLLDMNYKALDDVENRVLEVGGIPVKLQFNPGRLRSSAASVDKNTIKKRACFLCPDNRPEEQAGIPCFEKYVMLVNPYPIFPRHLTFPSLVHTPQSINGRVGDMLDLSRSLTDYVLFYNGPRCGASAPDHMHFQAGNKGFLPIESAWNEICSDQGELISRDEDLMLWSLTKWPQAVFILESSNRDKLVKSVGRLLSFLRVVPEDGEPMVNLLSVYEEPVWRIWVFPRRAHRPSQYFMEGDSQRLVSPGSVDVGGIMAVPRLSDFEILTASEIEDMFRQISVPPEEVREICNRWAVFP